MRIHRSLVKADMLEVFSDPSILKSSLNAIIIHPLKKLDREMGS